MTRGLNKLITNINLLDGMCKLIGRQV